MNFDLSEEQQLLADTVGKLFETHANVGTRDASAEWRDYVALGLPGLPFPAALGGHDGGHEAVMLVMEAYGRTLAEAPYLQSILLAGRLLALAGAQDPLAAVIDGGKHAALCLYEPGSRYRWEAPTTRAVRTGKGWTLDGRKIAILDAGNADLLLCAAGVDDGFGLFCMAADTPGITRQSRPTPDGRSAADITFSNVSLPADAAIGLPATNRALLAETIDGAIAACCSEAIGAMDRLLAITVDYLRVRQQFGVAIGNFQALQHRAADMLVAIEQARSMTIYAVSMLETPAKQRGVAVAAAKALVNRAARFVGSEAIQLHGGMGLAAEYPAGRYFQRLTVLETLFGDTGHLLARVEQGGGLSD
jgi:alkylation response protein AidB-like acyl-CoA dehydrogenase